MKLSLIKSYGKFEQNSQVFKFNYKAHYAYTGYPTIVGQINFFINFVSLPSTGMHHHEPGSGETIIPGARWRCARGAIEILAYGLQILKLVSENHF